MGRIKLFQWGIPILFHLYSYFSAIQNQSFYQNDSVIYMTLAENLQNFQIFSASFTAPIVPDFHRTPLYPIFLMFFPVPVLLLAQHFSVFATAWFIAKIIEIRHSCSNVKFWTSWIWCTMPYSVHLASFVLTESFFLLFVAIIFWLFTRFLTTQNLKFLLFFSIIFGLSCYLRPTILPFLMPILAYFGFKKQWKNLFLVFILVFLLLLPWYYRNYSLTGNWFFTSISKISIYYGRLGAIPLAFEKEMNSDQHLIAAADSITAEKVPIHKIKSYTHNVVNEENEQFNISFNHLIINEIISHPINFLWFQFRALFQQFTGVGYGMSLRLYQNHIIAIFFAIIQFLIQITIWTSLLWIVISVQKDTVFWYLSGIIVLSLFVHNAAWADGRYRYLTDFFALILVGFYHFGIPRGIYQKNNRTSV